MISYNSGKLEDAAIRLVDALLKAGVTSLDRSYIKFEIIKNFSDVSELTDANVRKFLTSLKGEAKKKDARNSRLAISKYICLLR